METGVASCSGQHSVHARSRLVSFAPAVHRSAPGQMSHSALRHHAVTAWARSHRRGHAVAEAAAADVETDRDGGEASTSGSTQIELQGKTYRVVELEGCEYLIATDSAGRLDLRDVYVHDTELDIFARPTVIGEVPDVPKRYQEVPWTVEFPGDTIFGKPSWKRVERVYLVEIREPDELAERSLALDQVYVLDHQTRDLCRGIVSYHASINEDTDPAALTLSIRKDGLWIDTYDSLYDVEDIVEAAEERALEQERAAVRAKSEAIVATMVGAQGDEGSSRPQGQPLPEDENVLQDPIDAMSDADHDGPDDTPAVDLGF